MQSQVQIVDPLYATLGGVVNDRAIVDLPIVNRNILTLMAIEPGVQPSTQNNYSSNCFTSAIHIRSMAAWNRPRVQQDGVSILNQSDIPRIMGLTMLPPVDAVDEMRVQTKQLFRQLRPQRRRNHDPGHEVGDERISLNCFRVPAQML